MELIDVLRLMARYGTTLNRRLYDAAETLPADRRHAPQGAFFGSIAGTLNHLMVADSIWLHRIADATPEQAWSALPREARDWLPRPTALSQTLFDDWARMRVMRERIDALVESWIALLPPAALDAPIAYRSFSSGGARRRLGDLLVHLFNHGTHHRGQVTTLLYQAGVDPGVTDVLPLTPLVPD